MRNGSPGAIAIAVLGGFAVFVVAGIYAPNLLGLAIPVLFIAVVILRARANVKAQKGLRSPEMAPHQGPIRTAQTAQAAQPAPRVAPPPPWWTAQQARQPVPTIPPPPPRPPTPPQTPPQTPVDPNTITVSPDLRARVEVLRKSGKTVEAIGLLREETGMELYPASRYVLAIEAP